MLLVTKYCSLVFVVFLMSAVAYRAPACAQKSQPEIISFSAFLEMCANQPDFIADWLISVDEPAFGIKSNSRIRIARKHGQSRREIFPLENESNVKNRADRNYKIILIDRSGQPPIALDPQRKTYTETPSAFKAAVFDIDSLIKSKSMDSVKVENVGTVTRAGHQATKIRLTFAGEAGEVFFYFARDPNNLIVGVDGGKRGGNSLIVSNIVFEVPDELFQIPQGYEKTDFTAFLETVRQKAAVYRSSKGKGMPEGIVEPSPGLPRDGGVRGGVPGPPPPGAPPGRDLSSSEDEIITTGIDSKPVLLGRPKANSTEEARRNKIQGIITVTLLIGMDGNVKEVRVERGLPDGLNEEAVKAAYLRRYVPAMKKGRPVPCWVRAKIEFNLD